jgi:predicted secreted acid phosphatase
MAAMTTTPAEVRCAIPNLTDVKQQIRRYYGDHCDESGRHCFSNTSQWARDVAQVVAAARSYVHRRLAGEVHRPAVVLDIDDTALSTYPVHANNEFGSRQNREVLPAIQPTLELACAAHAEGAALFFITERRFERHEDTMSNLLGVGYPRPAELFLRRRTPPYPEYLTEGPDCSTVQYKSATRAHIAGRGFTILASVGDQYSDLEGGHAERTFKLPNPMYFIPS